MCSPLLETDIAMSKQQGEQGKQHEPQWPTASKETVRIWLRGRIERRCPPPDQAQIRRELGWDLEPTNERKR